MAPLSQDAHEVLTVAQELKILDETAIKMLQQLFANRVDGELVDALVIGREEKLATALYKLVMSTHAEQTLGYVLRFLADISQLAPSLVAQYTRLDAREIFGSDPVDSFATICADHTTPGVFNPSLFLWASALTQNKTAPVRRDLAMKFLVAASKCLTTAETVDGAGLEFTIHAVAEFLRRSEHRTLFREAGLITHIPRLLTVAVADNSPAVVQLTYEILLSARLLTFDYECLVDLHDNRAIATVHRALQKATKEKVVRMSLFVLKSFAVAQTSYDAFHRGHTEDGNATVALSRCNRGKGPRFFSDMIGVGVLKTAKQLQRKKYGDEDIGTEIDALVEVLQSNFDEITGFTEYKGEVDSGVLEWSPVHTSARFWKENATKFEANQFEVLRSLTQLLHSGASTETTVAVACHDLGELVRHHPQGRAILDVPAAENSKKRIMELMSSESPEIAKAALTAVQKILVDRF